jgi:hypothetical protein
MKCKICGHTLEIIDNVYWCFANSSFIETSHYWAHVNGNVIIRECWITDVGFGRAPLKQDYILGTTYISYSFYINKIDYMVSFKLDYDYLLFDFNHFNADKWFSVINLLKFYD